MFPRPHSTDHYFFAKAGRFEIALTGGLAVFADADGAFPIRSAHRAATVEFPMIEPSVQLEPPLANLRPPG